MPDITKLAAQLRAAIARFNAADRGPGGYGLEDYGPAWRELNALCSPANLTTLLDALDALRVDAERWRWWKANFPNTAVVQIFGFTCKDKTVEMAEAAIDTARGEQEGVRDG